MALENILADLKKQRANRRNKILTQQSQIQLPSIQSIQDNLNTSRMGQNNNIKQLQNINKENYKSRLS